MIKKFYETIGKAQFKIELSPILSFEEDDDLMLHVQVNKINILNEKSIDKYLLDHGYVRNVSEEEYMLTGQISAPDYLGFFLEVENILNSDDSCYTYRRMSEITQTLNEDLYDDNVKRFILDKKVAFLLERLSFVIASAVTYENGIYIEELKTNDAVICHCRNNWNRFLIELGFYPVKPGIPNANEFIAYLQSYINHRQYVDDDFTFGDSVLSLIDEYLIEVDWFIK